MSNMMSNSNNLYHHHVQADEGASRSGCSSDSIVLRIKSQDGEKMQFKVKWNAPIKNLLVDYCRKKFLDLKVLRFVIDGKDFDYRKTPAQLGLKNNDLIVVLMYNSGG